MSAQSEIRTGVLSSWNYKTFWGEELKRYVSRRRRLWSVYTPSISRQARKMSASTHITGKSKKLEPNTAGTVWQQTSSRHSSLLGNYTVQFGRRTP